jgi:hypothetical protein
MWWRGSRPKARRVASVSREQSEIMCMIAFMLFLLHKLGAKVSAKFSVNGEFLSSS